MGNRPSGENYYENPDARRFNAGNMTRLGPVYGRHKSVGIQAAGNVLSGQGPIYKGGEVAVLEAAIDEARAAVEAAYTQEEQGEA